MSASNVAPSTITMIDRIVVLSVVPSPYQRDVFAALAARLPGRLKVFYFEQTPPDSPWPAPALQSWETILPGRIVNWRGGRSHINRDLPSPASDEFWIVNGAMTDLATQRAFRRLGRRHAWAFWGELPSTPTSVFKKWLQRLQYRPLRHARFIAAVGSRAVAAYQRLLPGTPVLNRPYACDLQAFARPDPTSPREEGVTFLFCGQMIARKGFDVLLRAFATVISQIPSAKLILVGRETELTAGIDQLPVTMRAQVENAGFQPPPALPAFFARADVFVLPSRHDGWGVVVNQAFGAGLPVIVTTAVGAGELVADGAAGTTVPPGDEAALASAMIDLANDPARRNRMSKAAQNIAPSLTPEVAADFWITHARLKPIP